MIYVIILALKPLNNNFMKLSNRTTFTLSLSTCNLWILAHLWLHSESRTAKRLGNSQQATHLHKLIKAGKIEMNRQFMYFNNGNCSIPLVWRLRKRSSHVSHPFWRGLQSSINYKCFLHPEPSYQWKLQ